MMASLRVLIVDNQRSVRRSLRSGLESIGQDFEILEATSGEEAMLTFAKSPPDLLITGMRLAGMSGLELLQRMRQQHPELKGILTAVNPDTRTGQLALKANANALIPKPIDLSNFLEAVYRCLGQDLQKGSPMIREDTSPGSLSERLEAMQRRIGVAAMILLDEGGQTLAEVGEAGKVEPVRSLISVLLDALGASAQLSQALGETKPDDLLCCAGADVEMFAAHVGASNTLLFFFDKSVTGYTRARSVRLVSEAVSEMSRVMPVFDRAQRPIQGMAENPPGTRLEENKSESAADLDAVFQQASKLSFDPQDVDSFWNTAVDQPNDNSDSGPDAISYDQAKDMGIVKDG